jgi:hypothetical protein
VYRILWQSPNVENYQQSSKLKQSSTFWVGSRLVRKMLLVMGLLRKLKNTYSLTSITCLKKPGLVNDAIVTFPVPLSALSNSLYRSVLTQLAMVMQWMLARHRYWLWAPHCYYTESYTEGLEESSISPSGLCDVLRFQIHQINATTPVKTKETRAKTHHRGATTLAEESPDLSLKSKTPVPKIVCRLYL